MARQVKATPTVIVGAKLINYMADNTVQIKELNPEDTLTDFKYDDNGTIKKVSGRLASVKYSGWKNAAIADKLTSKGFFRENSTIYGFVVDKSTENNADIVEIPAKDVLEYDVTGDVSRVEIVGTLSVKLDVTLSDETKSSITITERDVMKDATIVLNGEATTGNFLVVEFLYLTKPSGEVDVRGMWLKDVNGTDYNVTIYDVLKTGTVGDGVISGGGDPIDDEGDLIDDNL